MKKITLSIFYLCGICYLAMCAVLYFLQGTLLYFPQERSFTSKTHTYLLQTDVGKTVVTTEVLESNKAVIYFGGNSEDVSRNLDRYKKAFPGHSIFLMHYRGFGGSDGEPGEEGIYRDAMALYKHVKQDHNEIILVGRSLGSGVATRLAANKTPVKLILITPFSSVEDVASEIYWGFPVSLMLKDKYLSWTYAPSVKVPTSIILASTDKVIPRHSSMKLFDSFKPGIAQIYELENTGHNNIASHPRYYPLLTQLSEK